MDNSTSSLRFIIIRFKILSSSFGIQINKCRQIFLIFRRDYCFFATTHFLCRTERDAEVSSSPPSAYFLNRLSSPVPPSQMALHPIKRPRTEKPPAPTPRCAEKLSAFGFDVQNPRATVLVEARTQARTPTLSTAKQQKIELMKE